MSQVAVRDRSTVVRARLSAVVSAQVRAPRRFVPVGARALNELAPRAEAPRQRLRLGRVSATNSQPRSGASQRRISAAHLDGISAVSRRYLACDESTVYHPESANNARVSAETARLPLIEVDPVMYSSRKSRISQCDPLVPAPPPSSSGAPGVTRTEVHSELHDMITYEAAQTSRAFEFVAPKVVPRRARDRRRDDRARPRAVWRAA